MGANLKSKCLAAGKRWLSPTSLVSHASRCSVCPPRFRRKSTTTTAAARGRSARTSGPDAEVPGWYYNLGITGLRAQFVADEPKALLIKHVFPENTGERAGRGR